MTGDDSTRLALLERDVEYLKTEAQEELKYYVNNKLLSDSKVVLSSPVKNIVNVHVGCCSFRLLINSVYPG